MNNFKRIGIIMGDAAGIGPEIIIKTLTDKKMDLSNTKIVVIGSFNIMSLMNDILGRPAELIRTNENLTEKYECGKIQIFDYEVEKNNSFKWGVPDAINGKNTIEYIRKGIDLATNGNLDGIVFAPFNKESMHMAGSKHPDEFSLMKEITGIKTLKGVVKWNNIFRSSVVGHVAFKDIISNLNQQNIVTTVEYLGKTIESFLDSEIRIGVAGLNPHAGDGGAFGDEEEKILIPAIEECKIRFPYLMSGPFPADTVLVRAIRKQLDGIVYLYHDQGNIAMKSAAFGEGVLIYPGMPFCITNPGHGTAYGRAGKGYANYNNFAQSLQACIEICRKGSWNF